MTNMHNTAKYFPNILIIDNSEIRRLIDIAETKVNISL